MYTASLAEWYISCIRALRGYPRAIYTKSLPTGFRFSIKSSLKDKKIHQSETRLE